MRKFTLLLFTACILLLHNGFTQTNLANIRQDVIHEIKSGRYTNAITILENNSSTVTNDTTGLFDALVNLYFFKKEWNSIIKLYTQRSYKEEDNSILVLAKFYTQHPKEKITLNSIVQVPYKPNKAGTPIIEVKVNGKKYNFWVDTGAGMTVLSSTVAQACYIKQNPSNSSFAKAATGNNIKTIPGLIDTLSIDNLTVYNHHCMVFEKKDLEFRVLGVRLLKIDGIIGWNLLQELDVTINDKTKTVSFASSGASEPAGNFYWSGKPLIAGTDSVGHPLLFFIDTGASQSGLYEPYLTKADTATAIKKHTHMVSVGGLKSYNSYRFSEVKLQAGGQMLLLKDASVLPSNTSGLVDIDGVLGMKEFKNHILHFNITKGFITILN